MPYGLFSGGLPPGLEGYVAGQQLNERRGMNELAAAANIIGLRGQLQAQQQQAQMDPIRLKIAQLQLQQMQAPPVPAEYTLGPGQGRFIGNQQVASMPFKPDVLSSDAFAQQLQLKTAGRPETNVTVGMEKPLMGAELGHWLGPQGQRPPPGSTVSDLVRGGYQYKSTAEQNKLTEGMGAYATLDRLDELVGTLWPDPKEKGGLPGRAERGVTFAGKRFSQSDPNLAMFDSFSVGTLAPLIRAVGEKGNLATEDIERAIKLIPNTGGLTSLPDTGEVAHGKMRQLREWFDRAQGKQTQVEQAIEGAKSGPRRINSDEEYNALPSGAVFIGPDGKQRRKP